MEKEALKHALIAIIVGAAVNLILQVVQLVGGYILHQLPTIIGTAAGASAYLYQIHRPT